MTVQSQIAAAQAVAKEDLYYAVHKGIRLANCRMLVALGSVDPWDETALLQALGALSAHLDMALSHLTHENAAIHSAIESRVPGGSAHAGEDHDHHLAAFAELRRMAEEVAAATHDRPARLRRLYQRFALFVADDLTHMHEEETELQPLVEAHFTADEIVAIREHIVRAIPPVEMTAFMKVMLGAATRPEREAMVTGMHAGMPPEAFAGLMQAVTGAPWRMGDWAGLERAVC